MIIESVLLALLTSSPVSVAHLRSPDTLSYREISKGQIAITAPQGKVNMETLHDARIAVARINADSARAWYDALEVSMKGPQGDLRPATDSALHKEFVLRFDRRNHVQTLHAPDFPKSFENVTDLTRQFDDFFMPTPGRALTLGATWSDTTTYADTTKAGDIFHGTRAGTYKVVRDSVVSGRRVWIVSANVEQKLRNEGPGPQPGITAVSTLAGSDTGVFYIDKSQGYMVGRHRTGTLTGEIRYEGLPQAVVLPQTMTYTSSIEFLPRRD
jgi:hypothetical protein